MSNKVIWGAVVTTALVTGFSLDYYTNFKPVEVTKDYQMYNVTTFVDKPLQGAENTSQTHNPQQTGNGLQQTGNPQTTFDPQQAREEF